MMGDPGLSGHPRRPDPVDGEETYDVQEMTQRELLVPRCAPVLQKVGGETIECERDEGLQMWLRPAILTSRMDKSLSRCALSRGGRSRSSG